MMRLLLFVLFAYLVFRFVRGLLRLSGGRVPPARRRGPPRGEEMVRDPRCGTFLPRSDALTRTVGGKTHYFCSAACRDAFDGS